MKTLNYTQRWNTSTKAWRIVVKTDEEKQNEILNKFKKLIRL